jgi:exodeoxyribonuclease-1
MLYGGDFFTQDDRSLMNKILHTQPGELASLNLPFKDKRLPELFFRFRARNYPETLTTEETFKWDEQRRIRVYQPPVHGHPGLNELLQELKIIRETSGNDNRTNRILDQLEAWYQMLGDELAQ